MKTHGKAVAEAFFTASPVECARELIGCELVWGGCSGLIVETEAYAAVGDEACHTAVRPSARDFVARHPAGTAYVYLNYGVHWLFNVLVKGCGGSGFVLFRALEPRHGSGKMRKRRGRLREADLCSGPGKLTQALGIGPEVHGVQFLRRPGIEIIGGVVEVGVVSGPRIGISRDRGLPWRFGASESSCLSGRF